MNSRRATTELVLTARGLSAPGTEINVLVHERVPFPAADHRREQMTYLIEVATPRRITSVNQQRQHRALRQAAASLSLAADASPAMIR